MNSVLFFHNKIQKKSVRNEILNKRYQILVKLFNEFFYIILDFNIKLLKLFLELQFPEIQCVILP
jgi:hypothetical protein